ncbi:hypothetical protein OGAPHI_000510 [Ogataea philodendri]|uniref:Uncharacterized protein n=1 Tax=Ogataea philodendri TaxID=1378263 RepID=A0A9P8PG83_9ASCO|nr:uncharacterized protein OGAPHI_000510 [Ogataea philodendri]KAH3671287.1 hypothetical protein OGAPHI_000510 [Ogataea philodendri]
MVAISLPNAPNSSASKGLSFRLRLVTIKVFSCSKMVYWMIGFKTKNRAGTRPLNRLRQPSFFKIVKITWIVLDGADFLADLLSTVSLVFAIQIGFVATLEMTPATRPATILCVAVRPFLSDTDLSLLSFDPVSSFLSASFEIVGSLAFLVEAWAFVDNVTNGYVRVMEMSPPSPPAIPWARESTSLDMGK